MAYQWTRQDNGWPEQQVFMLREEGQKYQDDNIEEHDAVIELSCTDLIVVARPQKMDDAGDGQNDQKTVCQIVGERDAVVGREERHLCEWLEMAGERGKIALV